jgi:dihydroorotate dehydrogenase (fumarate)
VTKPLFPDFDGPPLMNAAGTAKTVDQVLQLLKAPIPAVMAGSFTLEERSGNPGRTFFDGQTMALNSMGLPGPGIEVWTRWVSVMARVLHDDGKQLWVSVAGFNPAEYRRLAEAAVTSGADAVELNLGCPNIWDGADQKAIVSFSEVQTRRVLDAVQHLVSDIRLGVKLSPILDRALMASIDAAIIGAGIDFVTCINTVPNCFAFAPDGTSAITFGSGLAGMSGTAAKCIALGQVSAHHELLQGTPIVGVGGITGGTDLSEFLHPTVGASACQVGTAYWNRGPRALVEILMEYAQTSVAA